MQRSAVTEFLHGTMTSSTVVHSIREALTSGVEKHFEILYYRKNGNVDKSFFTNCRDINGSVL